MTRYTSSWPNRKKMISTLMIMSVTFLTPISSAMIAPASDLIAKEFSIRNSVVLASVTSVFVLAYGTSVDSWRQREGPCL